MAMAEAELHAIRLIFSDLGLNPTKPREFVGPINCGEEFGDIPVLVKLPADFPIELPEVYVEPGDLSRQIPHHEESGKLCLFPDTGILIDTELPERIIKETLDITRKTLIDGLSGANKDHFADEFTAYWKGKESIRSICNVFGPSRGIAFLRGKKGDETYRLAADNAEVARSWARKIGHHATDDEQAYLVRFKNSFIPPPFSEPITNGRLAELIKIYGEDGALESLHEWLSNRSLPRTCILSIPTGQEAQRTLVALRIERPSLNSQVLPRIRKNEGTKQFVTFDCNENTRWAVTRLDSDFTIPRGGSDVGLKLKTVVLVGAGSIGSRLAEKLGAIGLGTIRIIDPDNFKTENLGRHILGIENLGENKAKAVAELLDRRFPSQNHEWKAEALGKILSESLELLKCDLLIVTIGDETVQMDLDRKLSQTTKRMHVWVEPLGLGGHFVSKLSGDSGCYNCLFERDPKHGLHNVLSFCEPGQLLQRSHSGCAGVFTPFSALDADRAANDAATYAVNVLLNGHEQNEAVSWLGDPGTFKGSGFYLSKRANTLSSGERVILKDFHNSDCTYCQS